MLTTYNTKRKSNLTVDKEKRYEQICTILKEHPDGLSAKEVAVIMCDKKVTPTNERNFSAPRLTELCQDNKVAVIGKKKCSFTDKMVAIYRLVS